MPRSTQPSGTTHSKILVELPLLERRVCHSYKCGHTVVRYWSRKLEFEKCKSFSSLMSVSFSFTTMRNSRRIRRSRRPPSPTSSPKTFLCAALAKTSLQALSCSCRGMHDEFKQNRISRLLMKEKEINDDTVVATERQQIAF